MKEGRELMKEAVKDAKSLKETALQAAKKQVIDELAPSVRALVEKSIKGALGNESIDRRNEQGSDYYAPGSREKERKFEESKEQGDKSMDNMKKDDKQELDMESIASFFPPMAEEPDAELEQEAMGGGLGGSIPMLGEEPAEMDPAACAPGEEPEEKDDKKVKKEAKDEADKESDKMDEEIEISEAELRKVYEAALQTEVQVKKGFGDMTKSGELEELDPGAGIADVKKGEGQWAEAEVPAKQDFTVKEMIQRGLAENKALRAKNGKLTEMVQTLSVRLHEVNLFNAKVLHVNRILNQSGQLTAEQKKVVLESIDKATSIEGVKTVYETIVGAFKASKSLSESKDPRKPSANAQRVRTSGSANEKVLRESVDRANNNDQFSRMRMLAGLTK
jgi:hypothetical protein